MTITPESDAVAAVPPASPAPLDNTGRLLRALVVINPLLCALLVAGDPLFISGCHGWMCSLWAPFRLAAFLLYALLSVLSWLVSLWKRMRLSETQRALQVGDRLDDAVFWHGVAIALSGLFWLRALAILRA